MSYEETWAKAAEADSQIGKQYEQWLAIARGLHGMRAFLRDKSGANLDASPLYRRAYNGVDPDSSVGGEMGGQGKEFVSRCLLLADRERI